jgi:hypothetical protein
MLAILLVVAFVLSVTPVVVFADCAGHTAQAQLVKSQPKEKLSTDKSESPVLIAQDESKQKTPEKKQ